MRIEENSDKTVLAATVLCTGRNPKYWAIKPDHWVWLPEGADVLLNVGSIHTTGTYQIKKINGRVINTKRKLLNNPLAMLKVNDACESVKELDEICTHISAELYVKIEKIGVASLMSELKKDCCTLEQALDKLTVTLRRAIKRHENAGANERTRRS